MILTHSGIFHADEVFAIAALHKYADISLDNMVRTRDIPMINAAKELPNVFVIDVGLVHDPAMNNFDHHHDIEVPASNVLVWNWLYDQKLISLDLWARVSSLMSSISNFDVNRNNTIEKWNEYRSIAGGMNLNNMIASFNRDPNSESLQMIQFLKAVNFAIQIFENEEYKVLLDLKAEELLENVTYLAPRIGFFEEYCSLWKPSKLFTYIVQPNPNGWAVLTSDSSKFPIHFTGPGVVFQHPGNFITVFATKKAAIEAALTLKNKVHASQV